MKIKASYIFNAIGLAMIGYFAFNYFYQKHLISEFYYGAKANSIRTKLNVPIIDDYMESVNPYNEFGNRWESSKEEPEINEVLHVWKSVSVDDSNGKIEEMDGFRKNINGRVAQFNIDSDIYGDTLSKRRGKIFYYKSELIGNENLTENQIDSISREWGLNYLVK